MNAPGDGPRPRLLCSTAPFFARPIREAFHHISEAGFTGVEVMVTKDPASQEAHLLAELAREYGLSIEAIHAPFLLVTRKVWGTEPVGKIYRAVELARGLRVPLVVVHPPYRWQTRYRRFVDKQLAALAADTGVIVAVENMFPFRIGPGGVRFHADQGLDDLERFHDLVLDTSHAAVSGLDLLQTFRRLGKRVVHVHLSNNAGKGWDSHLPVDEGILPLPEFLDLLSAEAFAGTVSLELDLRQYLDDDRAIRDILVRNREFCEERLALSA